MPYDVKRRGSNYVVVDDSGSVVGTHESKQEAINHQRALYANVPDAKKAGNPCWQGYVQRGTKPGKDGKPVPNCIPVEKEEKFWQGSSFKLR